MKSYLKPYLLSIFVFLLMFGNPCVIFSNSQTELDSLLLITLNQEDNTEKVDNLLKIAFRLKDSNTTQALEYCNDAEQLAKKLNYTYGELDVLYKKATIYKIDGKWDSAEVLILQHIKMAERINNRPSLAKGYYQFGNINSELGNYDTAIVYFKKSLQEYWALGITKYDLNIFNALGHNYNDMAMYDSAIIYLHKARELCEQYGCKDLALILNNLGKAYLKKESGTTYLKDDFSQAKEYLNRSLEINNTNYDSITHALLLTNFGIIAVEEGDFDLAEDYYRKAFEIFKEKENQRGLVDLLTNRGAALLNKKQYDEALEMFQTALQYYRKHNIIHGMISTMTNISVIMEIQEKTSEAIAIQDTCLKLSFKSGDDKRRSDTYKYLCQLYAKTGDFQRAFEYQSKYDVLDDTIYSINKEIVIKDLEERYQKQKRDAELLIIQNKNLFLEKENAQSEYEGRIFLFSGIGSIIILLLIFAYHKNASNKNKVIAEQKIKQLEEEKKLLAARSIVEGQEQERKRIAKELHDGLGVLLSTAKMQFTTIKDKSPENRPLIEKAKKLLEQAAGDVRKISHNMMPGLLTRYGFYEAVEDLFEQLDDMHGLTASSAISGNQERLPENTEIMLYRIVQEMANNTLKHAEASEVQIDIVILSEQLSIDYSDNGKGFDVQQTLANKSIGLTSIQSRVNFLNGNLEVQSKAGEGVNYHITIPVGSKALA